MVGMQPLTSKHVPRREIQSAVKIKKNIHRPAPDMVHKPLVKDWWLTMPECVPEDKEAGLKANVKRFNRNMGTSAGIGEEWWSGYGQSKSHRQTWWQTGLNWQRLMMYNLMFVLESFPGSDAGQWVSHDVQNSYHEDLWGPFCCL